LLLVIPFYFYHLSFNTSWRSIKFFYWVFWNDWFYFYYKYSLYFSFKNSSKNWYYSVSLNI
jgi:hypothetical protein